MACTRAVRQWSSSGQDRGDRAAGPAGAGEGVPEEGAFAGECVKVWRLYRGAVRAHCVGAQRVDDVDEDVRRLGRCAWLGRAASHHLTQQRQQCEPASAVSCEASAAARHWTRRQHWGELSVRVVPEDHLVAASSGDRASSRVSQRRKDHRGRSFSCTWISDARVKSRPLGSSIHSPSCSSATHSDQVPGSIPRGTSSVTRS